MNEKEFIHEWQKKVKEYRIIQLFEVEGYKLWDFFEPILIGNSSMHNFYGYPQLFKVVTRDVRPKPKKSRRLIFNATLVRLYITARIFLRAFYAKNTRQGTKDILFLSSTRFDGKTTEDHQIFGNLFKFMKKKNLPFKLVKFDLYYGYPKRIVLDKDTIFIGEYYKNKKMRSEIRELEKIILVRLQEVKDNKSFKKLFLIEKDYYPMIKDQIEFFFKIMPIFIADILIATKEIINQDKPKCILVVSEADFYSKGIIQNAKCTKTVALQFGEIVDSLSDINPSISSLPSLKCVNGLISQKNLIHTHHYPKEIIRVTGEPRYDSIKESINKDQIYNDLGLDKNKKTVIFFDQGPGIAEIAEDIAVVLKNKSSSYNIIIKLHPIERNTTLPIYQRVSDGKIKITRYDTRKLIQTADLVLACTSTVILEAIIAGKPIVMINLNHIFPKYLNLGKEGSVLEAFSAKDLDKSIEKGLHQKKTLQNLSEGRRTTLKMHYGVSPGSSSRAIYKEIQRIIKKS